METRYLPNHQAYQRLTTQELRKSFVLEHLFAQGSVNMVYCDADRAIAGGVVPTSTPLKLAATKKEMAAEYFTERRELGIVNIGSPGKIRVDGSDFAMAKKDMLYVGRGVKNVEFSSTQAEQPAAFFFVSFPAHTAYPVVHVSPGQAEKSPLGSPEAANKRTINKYIHAANVKTCQLAMGLTELESGSVWNTMPPHSHQRRIEIYLYFDLDPNSVVFHLMGTPEETRSLVMRNQQGVVSPSWSIHSGVGTRKYSFIWAMGGENQEFTDMDAVEMQDLL
jgi:4-deoxy-L-threo-5-hexosulose-uronate ketol-isomerase